VSDYSDNICFGGIANDGQYHQYDSYEGYHSYEWAVKLGMRVDCYEKVVTLTVAD
jgi:NADH:ubiquinone oxidoreductase subunit D